MTNYTPSFAELALCKKVLLALNEAYYSGMSKTGDITPHLDMAIEDCDAMMSGMCASVTQADEQDTKKPYRGPDINKTTEEGSPMYEFNKLQKAEDNRVNFAE